MDTIQDITNIIQVNSINWGILGTMIGIMLLGGLLYNLIHARTFFFNGFNMITLIKENYMRLVWVFLVSSTLCFVLQLIPGVNDYINNLIAFEFEFSSVGLLIIGGIISKIAFENSKPKRNETDTTN